MFYPLSPLSVLDHPGPWTSGFLRWDIVAGFQRNQFLCRPEVVTPPCITYSKCMCKQLHHQLSWLCAPEPEPTSRKPSHDISYQLEWLGIAAALGIPPRKSHSGPTGRHFSPFHLPRSGNGNDIPLKRGKNSAPWQATGATWRASCRNEIPVRDEWAVRGMLGKKKREGTKKVCAAAGLRVCQSQKAAILVFLSNFDECWTAICMMDSVKRCIQILDGTCVLLCLPSATY